MRWVILRFFFFSLFFLWEIIAAGMILLYAQRPQPCFVRN